MKNNIIVLLLIATVHCFANYNCTSKIEWGPTGHRAVGEIAEQYLTKKAHKKIQNLLDGQSLALVSTYGDEIKSDDRYKKFSAWHYVNFPFDSKYENSEKNPQGDIIQGIAHCIKVLEDENSSVEDQVFYLKFLVHLMGDLHQPLHVGKAEDKGGNDFQVRWHNKGSNLHRVWDSDMINSWGMSYTELAINSPRLSKDDLKLINRGNVLDWTYESQKLAKEVYQSAKIGEKLGYRYSYQYVGVVRIQLQKAGIRLAKVLNNIYG